LLMKNKIDQFLQKEAQKSPYISLLLSQNVDVWYILLYFSNNYLRNHGIPPVRNRAKRLVRFCLIWDREMCGVLDGMQNVAEAAQKLADAFSKGKW